MNREGDVMLAGWRLLLPLVFAGFVAIGFPAGPVCGQALVPEAEPNAAEPKAVEPKVPDLQVVPPKAYESGLVIVIAETAEVREDPSPRSEVITVVERGEVFEKQGRTNGWYYIRLGEDAYGWVSGRAIRRYQQQAEPAPDAGPVVGLYDEGYYPEPYYNYPYYWGGGYYWGEPYYWGDRYYYGYGTHRYRDYYYNDHRYHYRPWVDGQRSYRPVPRVYNQQRNTLHRGYVPFPPRPGAPVRSFAPAFRPAPPAPFRRR